MKTVLAKLLPALALQAAAAAYGQSIIASNPYVSPHTNGGAITYQTVHRTVGPGGPGDWFASRYAVSFATGASDWTLTSVSLNLALLSGSSDDLSVSIWSSDTPSAPDSFYAPLVAPTISAQDDYAFTTGTAVTLAANSTYWIMLEPSLTAYSSFGWSFGEDPGTYNTSYRYGWSNPNCLPVRNLSRVVGLPANHRAPVVIALV